MDELIKKLEKQMKLIVTNFINKIRQIHTGRATPVSLYGININYFDTQTPIEQISNISSPGPLDLIIKPYDINYLKEIHKTINLKTNFNAKIDGNIIRIRVTPMTADKRKEIVRDLHLITENYKIKLRQIRHQEINAIKKDTTISGDMSQNYRKKIENKMHDFIEEINSLVAKKEKEIVHI